MVWPLSLVLFALSASAQQALGVVLAAAVAAAATTLIARRNNSGSVRTADAVTIFQAGEAIRRELRDEVVGLRSEVKALRDENGKLQSRVAVLEAEVAHLRGTHS